MIDRESFMRMIRQHPDDHGPQLVFADWLEEQGEAELAEFVRAGLALAAIQPRLSIIRAGQEDARIPRNAEIMREWRKLIDKEKSLRARQLALFRKIGQHRVPCDRCKWPGTTIREGYDAMQAVIDWGKRKKECPKCHGDGFTLSERMNGQEWFGDPLGGEVGVKCERCFGKGKINHVNWEKHCPDCVNGHMVTDLAVRVPMGECHCVGYVTGMAHPRCPDCGGDGNRNITYTVSSGLCVSVACTLGQYVGEPCSWSHSRDQYAPNLNCPRCHGHGYTSGIARDLFARFPVPMGGVALTDRQPVRIPGRSGAVSESWNWMRNEHIEPESPWFVPRILWDLIELPLVDVADNAKFAATAALANAALASAAWRLGRRWAGLEGQHATHG